MTWMTRRPDPEPEPTIRPAEVVSRPMPRLSGGFRWSQLVAEMAADRAGGSETGGNAPNPWTPDPEGEAA